MVEGMPDRGMLVGQFRQDGLANHGGFDSRRQREGKGAATISQLDAMSCH